MGFGEFLNFVGGLGQRGSGNLSTRAWTNVARGRVQRSGGFQVTRVYVLGSGFSRAVSQAVPDASKMPTLKELSQAVLDDLDAKGRPPIPGRDTPVANDFEQWLSYLIESPPWLTASEQQRNRAAFLDVSQAVHDVLEERQMVTVRDSGAYPDWLAQLVNYWEENDATVITFNYDQLVELAWLVHGAGEEDDSTDLHPVPIAALETRAGGSRQAGEGLYRIGRESPKGLRLLKLHGSLGWYYSGVDGPPNDTIYDWGLTGSEWGVGGILPVDPERAPLMTADLQPMIVPPAAIKSP